jgi:hypothetical protein
MFSPASPKQQSQLGEVGEAVFSGDWVLPGVDVVVFVRSSCPSDALEQREIRDNVLSNL